ncbi:MAG TPA: PAS domain S-box protein [Candidatus Limnocylindrales bacterium]|nr:PAS domain S-box protein [Candidatus Limnocylindrales bacterium]
MKRRTVFRLPKSLYGAVFESAEVAFSILDSEFTILEVNRQTCELYGYRREEILGRKINILFPAEVDPISLLHQSLFGTRKNHFEIEALRKDGARIPVLILAHAMDTPEGKYILLSSKDLIRERQIEEEIRRNEHHLRNILNSLLVFVGVLTPDGVLIEVNQTALEAALLKPEEVIGKFFEETYWWSYSPLIQVQLRAAIQRAAQGEKSRYDVVMRVGEGHFITVDFALVPEFDPAGQVSHLIASAVDITERKQVEEALRQSEERARAIVDTSVDGIITIDERGSIELFNKAAERIFGYRAEEVIGQNVSILMPPPYREEHNRYMRNYLETGKKKIIGIGREVLGQHKDGTTFPIDLAVSEVHLGNRRIFTGIVRDITERKRAEEQLREQATLLNQAQDAIVVRDLKHRVLFWNKSAERIYGWTAAEVIGKNIQELLYRGDLSQFEEAHRTLMEKGEWRGELKQLTKDGKEIIVEGHWALVRDDKGLPKSVLVINTDVTEKKKLEAQFLRAQRMESLGTLAGGIAHDLNNVLAPILMAIKLLQRKFTDEQSQRLLATLRSSAERGAGIINQLLSFARGAEGEHIVLQPRHLIKEIEKILKETLPKSIQIHTIIPEDLWSIHGDATQLYQVLMNLCVNARDAMPKGGKLTLEAENIQLDASYARMHLEAKSGPFVLITVTDTGVGIPASILDKIFEPFFTTKEHGQGTGLGLSTALGIVKGHGGFINVYSEIGKGTRFKIYLPAIKTEGTEQREEKHPELPMGHGELILVVDDEVPIQEVTKETLESYGYKVLTASDGAEAVALYAENKEKIQVVLLDMMMPYMDGPATIRALQKLNPQVKIIAASGLKMNGKAVEMAEGGIKTFLSKPYTAEKLLKTLAEVLNSR